MRRQLRSATAADWSCGTRVTTARSASPAGTLRTSAGRTFAAMPRSTNQTSPRSGTGIRRLLAAIEIGKHDVRREYEVVICWKIVRRRCDPTQQFREDFRAVCVGKRLKFFERFPGRLSHECRVAPSVLNVNLTPRYTTACDRKVVP